MVGRLSGVTVSLTPPKNRHPATAGWRETSNPMRQPPSGVESRHPYHVLHLPTSLASQGERRVHFGLGADTTLESLVIHWPSGRRRSITGEALNGLVDRTTRIAESVRVGEER